MEIDILFEVKSALGKRVRITKEYWNFIITYKHPQMKKLKEEVKKALTEPEEIRISNKDSDVYLFYRRYYKYFICVVVKHLNEEAFIITTYLTDQIKAGRKI